MKQTPILMSTPMVAAIIEGRKTMTRRIVKQQPTGLTESMATYKLLSDGEFLLESWPVQERMMNNFGRAQRIKSLYGKVGELLYVRESYYAYGNWIKDGLTKKGNQKWKFKETGNHYEYEGSVISMSAIWKSRDKENPNQPHWYKRLGRFMPKAAVRIWLEITDIKVERLRDIAAQDAINEGIEKEWDGTKHWYKDYQFTDRQVMSPNPIASFISLWHVINGVESWNNNPWVWAVSFHIMSISGKPKFDNRTGEPINYDA